LTVDEDGLAPGAGALLAAHNDAVKARSGEDGWLALPWQRKPVTGATDR
jgi:hypothetical protein